MSAHQHRTGLCLQTHNTLLRSQQHDVNVRSPPGSLGLKVELTRMLRISPVPSRAA